MRCSLCFPIGARTHLLPHTPKGETPGMVNLGGNRGEFTTRCYGGSGGDTTWLRPIQI